MGEWEKCEQAVKSALGGTATPATLRRAVLNYAVNRFQGADNLVEKRLSQPVRWSWNELRQTGRHIAYRTIRFDPPNPESGIANALISLVDLYMSADMQMRKKDYLKRRKEEWNDLVHCSLCWRLVPNKRRKMQRNLCSQHEPRTATYQRHSRFQEQAVANYREMHISQDVDHPARHPPENPMHWLMEYYPQTYLHLVAEGIAPSNWLTILKFLDDHNDPYSVREREHIRMIEDRQHLLTFIGWTEAWLTALSQRKRGGTRPNAGRTRKKRIGKIQS